MSNIPIARDHLAAARRYLAAGNYGAVAYEIEQALQLMTREKPVRLATRRREYITEKVRQDIHDLSRRFPDMTQHEIANRLHLRSVGRVSEVLNHLR